MAVTVLDQSPIKGSRRSNPATYAGMADPIRKAFAKAHGVKPALFSANSEGACPVCKGAGIIYTDLAMMATVESTCELCGGRGFADEVLIPFGRSQHFGGRAASCRTRCGVLCVQENKGEGRSRDC